MAFILLLIAAMLYNVASHPQYWVTRFNNNAPEDCLKHPIGDYGRHRARLYDSSVKITVLIDGKNWTDGTGFQFCPGTKYKLQITWSSPANRRGMVTVTTGGFSNYDNSSFPNDCPNRVFIHGARSDPLFNGSRANFTTTLSLPCTVQGPVLLEMTTSNSSTGHFLHYSLPLHVNPICAASKCRLSGKEVAGAASRSTTVTARSTTATPPSASCTSSTLSYACSQVESEVTVHWSVGAAAPSNLCTTSAISETGPTGASSSMLNMAVEATTTGYVGIGFIQPSDYGYTMYPADVVLGYVDSSGLNGSIATYKTTTFNLASSNEVNPTWASNMAVVQTANSTIICFSRLINDSSATVVPSLNLPSQEFIWAVGKSGPGLYYHGTNAAGFTLDLTKGYVADASPPAPEAGPLDYPPPSLTAPDVLPAPAAAVLAPDAAVVYSPPPSPVSTPPTEAASTNGSNTTSTQACTPSSLGYACSQVEGEITLHWSVGTPPPSNPCTTSAISESGPSVSYSSVLNMAVEAATTGYVGIGFAQLSPSPIMYPADIVLGYVDSNGINGSIATYTTTGYYLSSSNEVNPSWASNMAVVQTANSTIICFSRQINDTSAPIVPYLSTNQQLIWAVGTDGPGLYFHGDNCGGFVLNLESGTVDTIENNGNYWVTVHGALMASAWAGLIPLGSLLPMHRSVLKDARLCGYHLWFQLHRIIQLAGSVLLLSGFTIAFVQWGNSPLPGGNIGLAHKWLGVAVMGLVTLQIMSTFIRPTPESKLRWIWNMAHRVVALISILAAWATMYMGIYMYHEGYGASIAEWVAPIISVSCAIMVADVVMRIVELKQSAKVPPTPKSTVSEAAVEDGLHLTIKGSLDHTGYRADARE